MPSPAGFQPSQPLAVELCSQAALRTCALAGTVQYNVRDASNILSTTPATVTVTLT